MTHNYPKNISDPADESVNAHFPEPFHFHKEKINLPEYTKKSEHIDPNFVPANEKKVTTENPEEIPENDYENNDENEKKNGKKIM
jgi:hypothetical protein